MMLAEDSRIQLLSQVGVFQDLSFQQLSEIAPRFSLLLLEPGQPLFIGREAVEDLYIVQSGKVFIRSDEGDEQHKPIEPGGYFIEESYLYDQPAAAYITTDRPTELLHLDEIDYYQLFMDFPEIKPRLARSPESQQLTRAGKFSWVGED
jgi:CRP-like cAMP-binding protein